MMTTIHLQLCGPALCDGCVTGDARGSGGPWERGLGSLSQKVGMSLDSSRVSAHLSKDFTLSRI